MKNEILSQNIGFIGLASFYLSLFYISADMIILDKKIKNRSLSVKYALLMLLKTFILAFITLFIIICAVIFVIDKYY